MSVRHPSPPNNLLRDPPRKGARRSAYEVEVDPFSRREEVEAALLFRGTIVSAHGYVESRLGEIAVRASRTPALGRLRAGFPFPLDQRVAFLREAFSIAPLSPHARWANLFIDRFQAAGELRHLVAHARMGVIPGWGVTFDYFQKAGPGMVTMGSKRLTMADLELEAWRAARLSRLCQELYERLEAAGLLPPI